MSWERHPHELFHDGMVPDDQLATGTAEAGDVPVSNGDGTRTWGPGGGGGGCAHQHVTDTFTAAGGSPETFTLSQTPLGDRRAYLNGLRARPADVGGSGTSLELDTAVDDEVVVDYEIACEPPDPFALAFPGTDLGGSSYNNVIATVVATGPGFVPITIVSAGIHSSGLDIDMVDATGLTTRGLYGSDGFTGALPTVTPGIKYLPIPSAGTWYIVTGTFGSPYDPSIDDGVGSWTIVYPTTPTGSLTFPGSSDADLQNDIGSAPSSGDAILFLELDSAMPSGYFFGAAIPLGPGVGDGHFIGPDPALQTYVLFLAGANTWTLFAYIDGVYDGGITGSGSYELVAL